MFVLMTWNQEIWFFYWRIMYFLRKSKVIEQYLNMIWTYSLNVIHLDMISRTSRGDELQKQSLSIAMNWCRSGAGNEVVFSCCVDCGGVYVCVCVSWTVSSECFPQDVLRDGDMLWVRPAQRPQHTPLTQLISSTSLWRGPSRKATEFRRLFQH